LRVRALVELIAKERLRKSRVNPGALRAGRNVSQPLLLARLVHPSSTVKRVSY
jgi:hypothetical protein